MPRSTYYYQPESAENLRLLRALDELYLKLPFYGSRKMPVELGVGRQGLTQATLTKRKPASIDRVVAGCLGGDSAAPDTSRLPVPNPKGAV